MINFNDRISSLETEYALIINRLSGGLFKRDDLISKLELSVCRNHSGVKSNSHKFIPNKQNPIYNSIIPVEGFFLDNGSRIYCDTGHLEWANPETNRPKDAILYEKAAEKNLIAAINEVNAELQGMNSDVSVHLIKNNIDYSDNVSYGCHENYSLRKIDEYGQDVLKRLEDDLVPFLITRSIFCGSGRIGARTAHPDDRHAFQLSQRADFIEKLISPNTRTERGVLTNKEEPLADNSNLYRLHLILGDSNISEFATFLKVGITSLILDLLELNLIRSQLAVCNPIQALQEISRNWASAKIKLKRGDQITALEIQKEYLRLAMLATNKLSNNHYKKQIVYHWSQTLRNLETKNPDTDLDWLIKRNIYSRVLSGQKTDWEEMGNWLYIIEKTKNISRNPPNISSAEWLKFQLKDSQFQELDDYTKLHGLDWQNYLKRRDTLNQLRVFDIHYHNISLLANEYGNSMDNPRTSISSNLDGIIHAQHHPPQNTRALQRWKIIRICSLKKINIEAYWDKIHFVDTGKILHLPDPFETRRVSMKQLQKFLR